MTRLELVGTTEGIEIYSYGNFFVCLPEVEIISCNIVDGKPDIDLIARIEGLHIKRNKFPGDCIAECEPFDYRNDENTFDYVIRRYELETKDVIAVTHKNNLDIIISDWPLDVMK